MSRDCNKCRSCHCDCHHCKPVIDCEKVLADFHKIIAEAQLLFVEAADLQDEALDFVVDAMKALMASLDLDKKVASMVKKAERELTESGCKFDSNADSCRCKELRARAEELFEEDIRLAMKALTGLKAVAEDLKEAKCYQTEATQVASEYIKCVHEKKHCNCCR